MTDLKLHEHIKFELNWIASFHKAVLKGFYSDEEAKALAQKSWSKLNKADVMEYFHQHDYQIDSAAPLDPDPVPSEVYDELATDCWEALEYFELI